MRAEHVMIDPDPAPGGMDTGVAVERLLRRVRALHADIRSTGDQLFAGWREAIERPEFLGSAANLADYLAFRRHDLTDLQPQLASLGLSSLGRAEAHIRPTIETVEATLRRLSGLSTLYPPASAFAEGAARIGLAQQQMFGDHPAGSGTRIMATLPSEAAADQTLVPRLIDIGASCFRINCAHDNADVWTAMLANVRRAAGAAGRHCPVLMDLGGPKCRIVEADTRGRKRLHRGDHFVLVREIARADPLMPAITISFPEFIDRLKPGSLLWINDGKIGARVVGTAPDTVILEISSAREKGERLKPEKGVNFPSLDMMIPSLTQKDIADLDFVAAHADVVGYSFVQTVGDVRNLQEELAHRRGTAAPQPILLKIETQLAVRNLPRLIVQAGARHPVAVMIARGDLAMEIGLGRLSEVQEEILWLCEAAHIPVVWATQVLDALLKDGVPSRAEVTDAAMGQRAECVMLNKGPHLPEAVGFLSDVLHRMDRHQHKKSARLSALTSWREEQAL
jgi:pyruvate kinase